MLDSKSTFHVRTVAGGKEREAHLVVFAIDRPKIAGLHLAALLATRLDRRLIHRLYSTGADRAELRVIDGLQQRDRSLAQLSQPGSTHIKATVLQSLVLPVQRQVISKLVY